jgi:hypothetical protein
MGNGSLQVQAQANFVTLSNEEEEGSVSAMEKFVLPTVTSVAH